MMMLNNHVDHSVPRPLPSRSVFYVGQYSMQITARVGAQIHCKSTTAAFGVKEWDYRAKADNIRSLSKCTSAPSVSKIVPVDSANSCAAFVKSPFAITAPASHL
jgi:hypothetical protein